MSQGSGRTYLLPQPIFPGVDGVGTAHYWDGYERAVVDVEVVAKIGLVEASFAMP